MGSFYGNKIRNKEINAKTGKAWALEDVPKLWKTSVEQWLEKN